MAKIIGNVMVGAGNYDPVAAKNFDDHFDACFGEARRKAAEEKTPEQRAREAADAGKKHALKVQARTARMRIQAERVEKEYEAIRDGDKRRR